MTSPGTGLAIYMASCVSVNIENTIIENNN